MMPEAHLSVFSINVCQQICQVGLQLVLRCSLLLAMGLLAGRVFYRRGPSVRLLIYRATLAASLLAALASLLPAGRDPSLWTLSLPPAATVQDGVSPAAQTSAFVSSPSAPAPDESTNQANVVDAAGGRPVASPTASAVGMAAVASAPVQPAAPHGIVQPAPVQLTWNHIYVGVCVIWAVVVGAMLVILLMGLCYMQLLRRSARPLEGPLRALSEELSSVIGVKAPALLSSARVEAPFAVGVWRPVIFLPSDSEVELEGAARAVLAHELAHLEQKDGLWNWLGLLLRAAIPFHPLAWILCRRMESASEDRCDRIALRWGSPPPEYARCLVRLAERRLRLWPACALPSRVMHATAMHATAMHGSHSRNALAQRVTQILGWRGETERAIPRPVRAAIAAAAACSALAALLLVSVTGAPARLLQSPGAAARGAHPSARAILERAIAAEDAVQTLTADVRFASGDANGMIRQTGTVKLMKPNYGRLEMREKTFRWEPRGETIHVDVAAGKTYSWWVRRAGYVEYYQFPVDGRYTFLGDSQNRPVEAFFNHAAPIREYLQHKDLRYGGIAIVFGVRCQVVTVSEEQPRDSSNYWGVGPDGYSRAIHRPNAFWRSTLSFYVGPDGLLRRFVRMGAGPPRAIYDAALVGVRTNVRLTSRDFAFYPPPGAKRMRTPENLHASLIRGKAPEFALPGPDGKVVTLSGLLMAKKMLLLGLIHDAATSRRDLVGVTRTYESLKSTDATAAVIDAFDPPEKLARFLKETPLPYPVLSVPPAERSRILKAYGIRVFPTTYLIDGAGQVVWSDFLYLDPGAGYVKMRMDHPGRWHHTRHR